MTEESRSGEVIVVGGGIIGIACAHYLTKAGYQVTVIERNSVAGACSHANCGFIAPSHVLPLTEPAAVKIALKSLFNPRAPFRVKPQWNFAFWKWMLQFGRRCTHQQMLAAGPALKAILDLSMHEYRQLLSEENFACEWQDHGLLYVFQSQKGLAGYRETDQLMTEHFGVSAREIPGEELPTFDPALKPGLAGAFHYTCDASLKPDLLAAAWSERLKERGIIFREECELTGVTQTGGKITQLQTSQGEMQADAIVFATGAWSPLLAKQLGCEIPILPGKGYSVTMAAPDPSPRHPMLFPEHKVGVCPFENRFRLGSMMEFTGYDSSIPDYRIEQLRESARPYLVSPYTETEYERWYGWRPMTWDSLPMIGPVPRLQNAWLAAGHNMLGMSMGAATGKLIAQMVSAESPAIDPVPYAPTRFG
ncbi:D-amino acid dehydrogenase small subunit [Gimesia panareensis]|uniref:D-amino acid dehydrogenase small subunit n=1 Tax=Gimesia panareensis TaxID=2527978 RepID=A0A517Q4B9_9PLAN|nr:FAD-dependent oxidoreductase [Gimesia panareensis]QDT26458.1 D-amino acid dehydrogenase small subunit [Gimesia panareensis]QDU50664.1 D-amino acid dehydrogenase small subunit [Gimesia panareensis]